MTKNKHLNDSKNYIKIIFGFVLIIIQAIICFLLFIYSKKLLYSSQIKDLYILLLFVVISGFNLVLSFIYLLKNRYKYSSIYYILIILCLFYSLIESVCIIKAFQYENSKELLLLTETYSLADAKVVKKNIENIFEKDYDNIFSRDIIINSFYNDDNIYNLYINDLYGNYNLKLYVVMNKMNIKDIYSIFNDQKLYLVKDGKKTNNFEFYYAMNIISLVFGEDIKGVMRLDSMFEEVISSSFIDTANVIFNYDEIQYQVNSDTFLLRGNAYNMDFYSNTEEKQFSIIFSNNLSATKKDTLYYGDSSFDYIKWDIEIAN